MAIENKDPEKRRGNPTWKKGGGSPNPGGRPRKLVEIERMLDDEHRTVDSMRFAFAKLRELALEGVEKGVYFKGALCGKELVYDAAFMKLYLDRVLGPVRDLATEEEIEDFMRGAPPEVLEFLRNRPLPS